MNSRKWGGVEVCIFRNFSQYPAVSCIFSAIAFCLSTLRAEVLRLEALGGLVTALQLSRNFTAIFRGWRGGGDSKTFQNCSISTVTPRHCPMGLDFGAWRVCALGSGPRHPSPPRSIAA